ncbi:hypothetical protein, partial [Bacillus cereus]
TIGEADSDAGMIAKAFAPPASNPLDVPTDAQTQSADAAVDALTDEEAIAVAQRMGKKIPARGDAKTAIKQEHPDDIAHGLAGDTWNGEDWTPSDEPAKATPNPNQAEIFDATSDPISKSVQALADAVKGLQTALAPKVEEDAAEVRLTELLQAP